METICTEVKNVEETTEHDAHCFDISVFPESSCLETVITGREMLSSPPPHPLTHTALTAHSPGGGGGGPPIVWQGGKVARCAGPAFPSTRVARREQERLISVNIFQQR